MGAAFVAESIRSLTHNSKVTATLPFLNAEDCVLDDYKYLLLFNHGNVLSLLLDKCSRICPLFEEITK